MPPPVGVVRDGPVVTLRLSLASGRLGEDAHAALVAACREVDLDEDVQLVVVRSRGAAFCLGDEPGVCVEGPDGIEAIAALRAPCLAVLQGDARDAGLELAMACDLRLAAAHVRVGLGQVTAGVLPFHGGTQRLPRIVGEARAFRMLLVGETIGAREATEIGLLNRAVPRAALEREARRLVTILSSRAPVAQRLAKETIRAAADLPLAEGLRLEGDLYVLLQTTRDRGEGIASFRERRRPRFVGR